MAAKYLGADALTGFCPFSAKLMPWIRLFPGDIYKWKFIFHGSDLFSCGDNSRKGVVGWVFHPCEML